MPHEIALNGLPGGYTITAARRGEVALIQAMGFTSSEDGEDFIIWLEGFPDELRRRLPPEQGASPSQVDHLLAIIRRDQTATVYVNEVLFAIQVRATRTVKPGEPVGKNEIADIVALKMFPHAMNPVEAGITVPADAGVVFLFSVGWRKGFFYDLTPIIPDADGTCHPRAFDLGTALGQVYAQLLFQERFSIRKAEWSALFADRWFPFAALPHKTIEERLAYVRAGWSVDELTGRIVSEVKEKVPLFLEAWEKHPAFERHLSILRRAAERFLADDPLSCTGLVFPRIEGLLRSNHAISCATVKPSQENLSKSAVSANAARGGCLLLPHRFERYLQDVYFASFDPKDSNICVSRNSVGHGVAGADQFDAKAAAIGLLVVEQLFYCFEQPTS